MAKKETQEIEKIMIFDAGTHSIKNSMRSIQILVRILLQATFKEERDVKSDIVLDSIEVALKSNLQHHKKKV